MIGDKPDIVEFYRQMLRIRLFEERVNKLFAAGHLYGTTHLYIGQEAVAVGVCGALTPDDQTSSTHRGHGHFLAKGGNMKRMMAELFGNEAGYCQGRGGSQHMADMEIGFLGSNGITGGGIPIATGAALSAKLLKTKRVVVSFFGDGATNQGVFHESLNMASIWDLPIVYVCENNLYGMSTPISYVSKVKDLAVRAKSYDMPAVVVDGCDVSAVYKAAREAVAQARQGKGPTFMECKTYRWLGHSKSDPRKYRSKEEEAKWRERCPIRAIIPNLKDAGYSDQEIENIKKEVSVEVEASVEFAKNGRCAPVESLSKYYYA
jgi:pyruvate dehydrogenase E1 component alpha subunit